MLGRWSKAFVIATLVLMTGVHWGALQTVAWATMLANNLCMEPASEAVLHTFDGEHLCPLCRAIAAAKKSEKKSEAAASTLKMEYPPVGKKIILVPPSQFEDLKVPNLFAESILQKPPVPPPRGFFV